MCQYKSNPKTCAKSCNLKNELTLRRVKQKRKKETNIKRMGETEKGVYIVNRYQCI